MLIQSRSFCQMLMLVSTESFRFLLGIGFPTFWTGVLVMSNPMSGPLSCSWHILHLRTSLHLDVWDVYRRMTHRFPYFDTISIWGTNVGFYGTLGITSLRTSFHVLDLSLGHVGCRFVLAFVRTHLPVLVHCHSSWCQRQLPILGSIRLHVLWNWCYRNHNALFLPAWAFDHKRITPMWCLSTWCWPCSWCITDQTYRYIWTWSRIFMQHLMSLAYIHIRVSGDMLLRLYTRFPLRGGSRMAARALSGHLWSTVSRISLRDSMLSLLVEFEFLRIHSVPTTTYTNAGCCYLSIPCITRQIFNTSDLTWI